MSLPHPPRATVLFSALFSPPAEQGGWPLVSTFTKPESWGGCPKMMDFTQQDGDPLLSSEINFMGCDQHYHTHYAHTRARTCTHTHTVEYTSGYGKQ